MYVLPASAPANWLWLPPDNGPISLSVAFGTVTVRLVSGNPSRVNVDGIVTVTGAVCAFRTSRNVGLGSVLSNICPSAAAAVSVGHMPAGVSGCTVNNALAIVKPPQKILETLVPREKSLLPDHNPQRSILAEQSAPQMSASPSSFG